MVLPTNPSTIAISHTLNTMAATTITPMIRNPMVMPVMGSSHFVVQVFNLHVQVKNLHYNATHATVCGLTATPQKMQNRSAGSGYAPHCGQRNTHSTSCTPQCMQN